MIGSISVKVTPEALVAQAEEVRRLAEDMTIRFQNLKEIMDGTRGYWIGEAGDLHRKIYNEQMDEIDVRLRRIKEHPDDLLAISENYRAGERKNVETAVFLEADIIS
ncbi:MAG: hypothetical protein IJP31_11640 [Lachnospiraceae bacterium]|nr:hypothetical protein [Lachnospiraceae bacterium]